MVRNYLGEVVATLSEIILISSSMVTLKTSAARRAVQFIQELDLHSSMFKGDSEISISTIRDQCFSHPTCDHLIKTFCLQLVLFRTILFLIYFDKATFCLAEIYKRKNSLNGVCSS